MSNVNKTRFYLDFDKENEKLYVITEPNEPNTSTTIIWFYNRNTAEIIANAFNKLISGQENKLTLIEKKKYYDWKIECKKCLEYMNNNLSNELYKRFELIREHKFSKILYMHYSFDNEIIIAAEKLRNEYCAKHSSFNTKKSKHINNSINKLKRRIKEHYLSIKRKHLERTM